MSAVSVFDLDEYRRQVERQHLVPPRPAGGLPPAERASEIPDPPPLTWLIEDVWPSGEFGLIVGDGGAFKSSVAIHMACAVAGGHQLFDEFRCVQRPALIISAEDHRDVVLMRAKAFCAGHGWPKQTLEELYILAEGGPTIGDSQWAVHIQSEIARIRPGLIVLDPWAELMGGDENSNTDARPAIKFIRRCAHDVGAAVCLVHHAGKMKEGGRSLDRIRGASALPSAARVIWFFEFSEAGLTVSNLKASRVEAMPPYQLERTITTTRGNRLNWTSARVTRRAAADPVAEKVLMHLANAPDGERSFNDLVELLNVKRTTLRFTLDRLVTAGTLQMRLGARRSQWYSRATGSHWFPNEGTSDPAPSTTPAPSEDDWFPAPTLPPKGERGGNQSSAAGAPASEPDETEQIDMLNHDRGNQSGTSREPVGEPVISPEDLQARLDERRGMGGDS